MEKREYLRIAPENLSVDISDGVGFFQGMVFDVSRFGICMTDLPQRINGNVKRMIVVVSGKTDHFRMIVRPKWHTQVGARKSVGVEIIDPPLEWTEFVMKNEPVIPQDVWGEIRL